MPGDPGEKNLVFHEYTNKWVGKSCYLLWGPARRPANLSMPITQIKEIREQLIELRNQCLGKDFDADGAVILSHTIRYLQFKIEGKPYEETTD